MKVLLISNLYPGHSSYIGIFVKQQVEALKSINVEIIPVVKNKETLFSYFPFFLKSIYSVLFTAYDVVHAHYGFHSALIPAFLKRKPLVITFHGSDARQEPFRNRIFFWLQKLTTLRADHIIAVSRDVSNIILSYLNANSEKISIISCGVDTNRFKPLDKELNRKKFNIPTKARVVLFIGKLTSMKGVDVLNECARQTPDLLFVFIGEGPMKQDCPNCINVGPVENNIIPLWINAADIFVLPSRSEGTPVVILEALCCGVPVIASSVGGIPDLIKDGEIGFLVDINSLSLGHQAESNLLTLEDEAKGLKEKICQLLDNDQLRQAMGRKGREKMINEYDNKVIAKKILSIYKKAIDSQVK